MMSLIPVPVFLCSFVVLTLVIVAGLYSRRVADKKKFVLWALLIEYLFLVVCAAVVFRPTLPEHHLHLTPFWVYTDLASRNHNEAGRGFSYCYKCLNQWRLSVLCWELC